MCYFLFRHSTTYRAETTLNYGMERVWALAASPDNNKVSQSTVAGEMLFFCFINASV